jgi:hypothetical protein
MMNIEVRFIDEELGDMIGDPIQTTLRRFADENNCPPMYVMRQEMREIGVYATTRFGIRCEVRPTRRRTP